MLFPPDTAKISPVRDQLTCQTTSSNLCKIVEDHCEPGVPLFDQIITRPSYKNKLYEKKAEETVTDNEPGNNLQSCFQEVL